MINVPSSRQRVEALWASVSFSLNDGELVVKLFDWFREGLDGSFLDPDNRLVIIREWVGALIDIPKGPENPRDENESGNPAVGSCGRSSTGASFSEETRSSWRILSITSGRSISSMAEATEIEVCDQKSGESRKQFRHEGPDLRCKVHSGRFSQSGASR